MCTPFFFRMYFALHSFSIRSPVFAKTDIIQD
jgi:hypothetical protein